MSQESSLLQAILVDPTFRIDPTTPSRQQDGFECFRTNLPSTYRQGFPPTWDFAVMKPRGHSLTEDEQHKALMGAEAIIRARQQSSKDIPLLLVSQDPTVQLANNLTPNNPSVFYIDATEIPPKPARPLSPRYSPLMMAVRRHLSEKDVQRAFLSPYVRNKPARSWRFFGRRKQLTSLMDSEESYIVVGGRRIGKTSLLQRLKQSLNEQGYSAYYVDVQDCIEEGQVTNRIIEAVDFRSFATAARRQNILGDQLLERVLHKISGSGRVVLLLDEIGNVISKVPTEHWRLFGVLRRFAHTGGLRVIMTSFQEYFLKQQDDFCGPFVNFASTMRLGGFSDDDIRDFVVGPLSMWGDIFDPKALTDLVIGRVGRHPLFLQHLCATIFARILTSSAKDILEAAREITTSRLGETFEEAVEDVFYRAGSSTIRYLFLRKCRESSLKSEQLSTAIMEDEWVEGELALLGLHSTVSGRRNILEGMEMRGFTEPVGRARNRQRIICPVIFFYVRAVDNAERLIAKYKEEIASKSTVWGFT